MTPRVLVVDDEKLIRWSVSERLHRRGYEVVTAESGEQALDQVSSGPLDAMLLDVRLPGIDGLETLKRALQAQPELIVVMMSAHSTVDGAVEAMKHGAVDFLVKPFSLDVLDSAVGRAIAAATTRRHIILAASGAAPQAMGAIIGDTQAMGQVREMVARLAAGTATVLIEGESGSGKEVVARAIHSTSGRANAPFLQLNCATLPEQLLESELFGHERGAFTDAKVQKRGLFETAGGGTVMLDEIGDLPAPGQAKLLRLLENKTFRRVGGVAELKTDARVIAATNADLEERVAEGRFRADLFFRLNVVRIHVPALRDRAADLPALAAHFVSRYNQEMKRAVRGLSAAALDVLTTYQWPGNVRELRNVVERAFILNPDLTEIHPEHLPSELRDAVATAADADPVAGGAPNGADLSLDSAERRLILQAMEQSRGNQSQAARLLGVTRDTLRYRLKKYALE